MQVLYLGRAPRTKETLPDFLKWRRVTRPPLVFRGLTGSQQTPEFGASHDFLHMCGPECGSAHVYAWANSIWVRLEPISASLCEKGLPIVKDEPNNLRKMT